MSQPARGTVTVDVEVSVLPGPGLTHDYLKSLLSSREFPGPWAQDMAGHPL